MSYRIIKLALRKSNEKRSSGRVCVFICSQTLRMRCCGDTRSFVLMLHRAGRMWRFVHLIAQRRRGAMKKENLCTISVARSDQKERKTMSKEQCERESMSK